MRRLESQGRVEVGFRLGAMGFEVGAKALDVGFRLGAIGFEVGAKYGEVGLCGATKLGEVGLRGGAKLGKVGLRGAAKLGKVGLRGAAKLGKVGLRGVAMLGKVSLRGEVGMVGAGGDSQLCGECFGLFLLEPGGLEVTGGGERVECCREQGGTPVAVWGQDNRRCAVVLLEPCSFPRILIDRTGKRHG